MLPNLIVIGAERSGTTSLHRYLDSHPQVFMSRQKELDFFVAERNWHRGRGWYERQFPTDAPIRGESSGAYTAHPQFDGVPARMAALIPGAKLIYLVRDPVERTISALHLARALGDERRSPAEALRRLEESPYVARSRYAAQLESYLDHVPRETILVVDSDRLRSARRDTIRQIFRHLGITEDAWNPAMEDEVNAAKQRRRNRAGWMLFRLGLRTIGDARTRAVMRRAPAWTAAPVTSPLAPTVLSPDLRQSLESVLAEDAARFRVLTGMAFESWCV